MAQIRRKTQAKRSAVVVAIVIYWVIYAISILSSRVEVQSLQEAFEYMVLLSIGIVLLVLCFGLWNHQDWGRKYLAWVAVGLSPLGILAIYLDPAIDNSFLWFIWIVINLLTFNYLTNPRVKKGFSS